MLIIHPSLSAIADEAHKIASDKGHYEPKQPLYHYLDHLLDEVLEARDAIDEGPERVAEELADVILLACSIAVEHGLNIEAAVLKKMEVNRTRPWKHGK